MTVIVAKSEAFVYLWTNNLNGRMYVGSHIGSANDGYIGSGTAFNGAVKKYGIINFTRQILEESSRDDIRTREQYWLDHFQAASNNQFYNLKANVGPGFEYVNSNAVLIEMNNDRCRQRLREMNLLRFKGKTHSVESKAAISKGTKQALEKIRTPVIKYDMHGAFVAEYESLTDAAASVNGSKSNIRYTALGKYSHAYGFKWKYK